MKKMFALLLSAAIMLGLLSGCGSSSAKTDTPAAEKTEETPSESADTQDYSKLKIAVVLSGNANDGGWSQMAADAAKNVAVTYGCTSNYTENLAATDFESTIQGYADAGYDIIVAHGAEFADAAKKIAQEYPDQTFINTSALSNFTDQIPNLTGIDFGAYQLGFLCGVTCAMASETGKIGAILSQELDSMLVWVDGVKDGVKYIDDSMEVISVATGSWDDAVKVKQSVDALAEKGCDIITQNADAASPGGVEECDLLGLMNVGTVGDYTDVGESCMISIIQNAGLGIESAISRAIDGTLPNGFVAMGADAGVIYLTDFSGKYADKLTAEQKQTLQDLWQQARDGADLAALVQ